MTKIIEAISYVHFKLVLYSGINCKIISIIVLSGLVGISMIFSIMLLQTVEIYNKFFVGGNKYVSFLLYRDHIIIDALFSEANSILIKSSMDKMG
ncbi:MAG: dihydrodipicolinate synthase family protein [Eggerthellaceae bacterium]|nr:dihydrodipicolinate synthase family protein [Eggerthellaceae bacterium]